MPQRRALAILAAVLCCSGCGGTKTFRLDILGGSGQGLSRITSDKENELGPSISADGRTLLFDTRTSSISGVIGIDPSTGARRTLYTSGSSRAMEAAWDRTGRYFVYTSNSTGSWSLVRSLSNSPNAAIGIVVSGEMAPVISDPDVSVDGRKVAFATRIRNVWSVATAGMDGSNFTLVGEGTDPAWSPDGKRLAFVRVSSLRAQIFTVDAETGADVVQVTSGDYDNFDPSWSPDGKRLVFSSNRSSRKAPRTYNAQLGDRPLRVGSVFQLFAVNQDGTGVIQLTDGNGMNVQPSWGSDGWIYFASNQAGNFDIWRLRPSLELAPTSR